MALATVADLMPLRGENRRLVREGSTQMAGTARPGLRALMAVSRTDPSGARCDLPRRSGWRRGSTPPAACAAPTPGSSCC